MKEPKLKKKSVINKIIKKQSFVAITTIFLLIFILVGSSYALLNANTETGLTDVVVQSGNLIATISSTSEMIEMNYTTLGVSDEVGLSYEPYTFTVKNDGENTISYYEIRIVDKEYEISTLPHKSLNYALSINDGDYTEPQNLGDNRSYIYVGGSLESGESDTFNLKLWVNEEFGKYANNKILKASIELTLYSDIPTRNYIIYDTQGGNYIPKTSVSSKRVTNQVPTKEGYSFAGWSSTPDGEVEYVSDAIYNSSNGTILYALYTEVINVFNGLPYPYNLAKNTNNITEVHFIDITDEEIAELNVETFDCTYNNQGKVTGWLEVDENDSTKSKLYIGSDGETHIISATYMFAEWESLTTVTFDNVVSEVTNMKYMFEGCSNLISVDFTGFDVSAVTDMSFMFFSCENLTTIYANSNWQIDALNLTDSTGMFGGCTNLVGAISYDENKIDINYANSDTGYFTIRN